MVKKFSLLSSLSLFLIIGCSGPADLYNIDYTKAVNIINEKGFTKSYFEELEISKSELFYDRYRDKIRLAVYEDVLAVYDREDVIRKFYHLFVEFAGHVFNETTTSKIQVFIKSRDGGEVRVSIDITKRNFQRVDWKKLKGKPISEIIKQVADDFSGLYIDGARKIDVSGIKLY